MGSSERINGNSAVCSVAIRVLTRFRCYVQLPNPLRVYLSLCIRLVPLFTLTSLALDGDRRALSPLL
jgi:hypothetical protein